MRYVLGIDAGGSKTVGLLADETGAVRARIRTEGANLLTHGELAVEKTLHRVMERLGARQLVSATCVGVAGADRPSERKTLRDILHRLGLRDPVQIVHDAEIALVAGAPERIGIVLVAGTGSIAYGVDPQGRSARSGGWGYLLGDEGSAFWLGQQALQRSLQALDGRGETTSLTDRIASHLDLDLATDLMTWIYSGDSLRYRVSRLVPLIQQAMNDGDSVAGRLIEEAAQHLSCAARAVHSRLELPQSFAVVLVGGAFHACPSLQARVEQLLVLPGAKVAPLRGEPAAGAVTMALDQLAHDLATDQLSSGGEAPQASPS